MPPEMIPNLIVLGLLLETAALMIIIKSFKKKVRPDGYAGLPEPPWLHARRQELCRLLDQEDERATVEEVLIP